MARTLRPMSRWISCVRPPICDRPRGVRVLVARRSIAYSAVIHPSPRPRREEGPPSSTVAAQSTRVAPKDARQEPSAYGATPRSRETARSASAGRLVRTDSGLGRVATKSADDVGGGLPRRERDDVHVAAPRSYLVRAYDGVFRIVAALHEDVGPQRAHEPQRRVLVEHDDAVHDLEGREHVGAVRLRSGGAIGALEPANGRVAVEADDERVAEGARTEQHVDVPGMQEIEDAVGEHDAAGLVGTPGRGVTPRAHLRRGTTRRVITQKMPSACGLKRTSRTTSGSSRCT